MDSGVRRNDGGGSGTASPPSRRHSRGSGNPSSFFHLPSSVVATPPRNLSTSLSPVPHCPRPFAVRSSDEERASGVWMGSGFGRTLSFNAPPCGTGGRRGRPPAGRGAGNRRHSFPIAPGDRRTGEADRSLAQGGFGGFPPEHPAFAVPRPGRRALRSNSSPINHRRGASLPFSRTTARGETPRRIAASFGRMVRVAPDALSCAFLSAVIPGLVTHTPLSRPRPRT
jgi:hypothetical protein